MTAARRTTAGTEDEFVTLDLVSPVGAIQRALVLESEALPAVLAVKEAAPALKEIGLRHLTISVGRSGGLVLECTVSPELEYQHESTHTISVSLRRTANEAGGWVETVDFVTADAE